MGRIVIDSKDVYQAKIEQQFDSEEFFSDVFLQADYILNEILDNSAIKIQDNIDKKYSRIGNNIIAFCGNRGQGKTSAMLSFARSLEKKNDGKQKFFVLNSIDPSALNKKESIVRVCISRLFYSLSEIIKDIPKEEYTKGEFIEKRRNLLELFQKCFDNIDYLNNVRKKDVGEDDLEYLSQLGDSGRLRENLGDLVSCFLNFVVRYKENYNDKAYLVITIDDADLALENIFKVCEDIRNYFSIKNTVVLLAADMEQLTYSIQREYMIRHEELIHASDVAKLREYYRNNCCKMASCYVEKIFPIGHRVELPRFEGEAHKKFETLKIQYLVKNEDVFAQDIYNACKNMQEQLLKMLYDRTGIVFLAEESMYHSFLPRTLRELTHFLQFLSEMECVDFEKVYTTPDNSSMRELRKNIDAMENYFFEHWCVSRLDEYDQKVFREVRRVSAENQNSAIVRIIDQYYSVKFSNSIPVFLQEGFDDLSIKIQTAFQIYYTIFYNKWYAYAYGNITQWSLIIKHSGILFEMLSNVIRKLFVTISSSNKIVEYVMNSFEVNADVWSGYASEELLKESEWVKCFCRNIVYNNGKIVSMTFDIFQYCITILNTVGSGDKVAEKRLPQESDEASFSSTTDITSAENKNTVSEHLNKSGIENTLKNVDNVGKIVWEIKNILANVDVYKTLNKNFGSYQEEKSNSNKNFLHNCYKNYLERNIILGNVDYLNLKEELNNLVASWISAYNTNQTLAGLIFIGNQQNRESYKEALVQGIQDYRGDLENYLNNLSNGQAEVIYENSMEREMPEIFLPLGISIPDMDEFKPLKKEIEELQGLYKKVRSSIIKPEDGKKLQQENIDEIVSKAQKDLDSISNSQGD